MASEKWSDWSSLRRFQVNLSGLDANSFIFAYLSGKPIRTSQKVYIEGTSHIIHAFLEGDYPRSSIRAFISALSTSAEIEWTMEEQLVGTRVWKQTPWGWWQYETTTYSQVVYGLSSDGKVIAYIWEYYRNFPEVSYTIYQRVKLSTDYGQTFAFVSDIATAYTATSGQRSRGYHDIYISDDGSKILVSGSTNNEDVGFYLSTNGGTSFSAKMTDRLVRWACLSHNGGAIYALDADYKLHKSTNDGSNWTEVTPSGGFSQNVQYVKTNYDGSTVLVRGNYIAYYTRNSGSTWSSKAVSSNNANSYLEVSGDGEDMAFMESLSFIHPPREQKHLIYTNDGGDTWTGPTSPLDFGIGNANFSGISLSGDGQKCYFSFRPWEGTSWLDQNLPKTWDDKLSFFVRQPPDMPGLGAFRMSRNAIYHAVTVRYTNEDELPVREAWIGREVLTSSIHAYVKAEEGSTIRGYLRGIGHGKDNISAYTSGITYIDDSSKISCYMFGGTLAMSSMSAYMDSSGQILVPNGDVSNDDWKNESGGTILYPSLADDNDKTYVWKQNVEVNDAFEVTLSDPFGIVGAGDHYLLWKIVNIGIDGPVTLKCEIYDGVTLVKTDTRDIETFPMEFIIKLTSGEIANISNYYNLTAKVTVVGVG